MPKGQRPRITPALRDRWVERWERDVARGPYRPFLRTWQVSSTGVRGRVRGVCTQRVHHLMSHGERLALAVFDHAPDTVDIEEQYPLLPVARTAAIARELGVKHPRYPHSQGTLIVMTTDFLVHTSTGERRAYAIKAKHALESRRTQEKLAVERAFWSLAGVPFDVITGEALRTPRHRNLMRLQPYGLLRPELLLLMGPALGLLAVEFRARPHSRISSALEHVAAALTITYDQVVELFFHGLWRGAIEANLDRALSLADSVLQMRVAVRADD